MTGYAYAVFLRPFVNQTCLDQPPINDRAQKLVNEAAFGMYSLRGTFFRCCAVCILTSLTHPKIQSINH